MRTRTQVAGAIVVVAALAACGSAQGGGVPAQDGWSVVPEGPLSARTNASVVWVGDRFVVVGGDDGPPCPPTADCVVPSGALRADGASFDPVAGAWARIADAPTPVFASTTAVVGDTLYVLTDARRDGSPPTLLAYDVGEDRWTTLPTPPDGAGRLVAAGDVVLSVPGSDELETGADSWFDAVTGTWHAIPDDPLGPSFDRSIVVVDGRVLLTAKDLVPSPGAEEPAVVRMAELDPTLTTWTVLPDSEVIGSDPVSAAGRLVFPDPGSADGGEIGNWGRAYAFGGVYDPATGDWADLPAVPTRTSWPRVVVGERVRVGDALLDPATGSTSALPASPWGATDSPSIAGSPTAVLAWGGMADGTATGFLLVP